MPSYTLRQIPTDLWAAVKARAAREERTLQAVLLDALQRYADDAYASGGRKAAGGMTVEARAARARKAAAARWSK